MTLNATTVSEWRSKAGSIVLTQGTALSQPTLISNYVNGRSALSFDGGDNLYSATAPLAIAPSTTFIVFDETTAVNFAGLLVGSPATENDFASATGFTTVVHDGAGNQQIRRGVQPLAAAGTALVADSQNISVSAMGRRLVSVNCTGSTAILRANGVDGILDSAHTASGSSVGTLVGGRFVGGVVSASFGFVGRICEVIHYSGSLSSLQISTVERWLAGRWGVTLP
jgi:hypothetical protein